MKVYSGESFASVYRESLNDLFHNPNYESSPRGLEIKENLGVALEITNPISSLYSNQRRGSQNKYIAGEFLWYFLGRKDVEYIKKYSSFWERIQNEDGTVNSSYGYLLFKNRNQFDFTQYEWAMNSLIADSDSRQAIMHFNLPDHQYSGNKDFVCTMYGIWQIRDNKLNFTIHMRSNDAILGTPTDIAFFTMLQQQAALHLRSKYPNLQVGKYTHIVDSYHIYGTNYQLVEEMLDHDFEPVSMPELSKDLINLDGSPTDSLLNLDQNSRTDESDPVFKWIEQNMNK